MSRDAARRKLGRAIRSVKCSRSATAREASWTIFAQNSIISLMRTACNSPSANLPVPTLGGTYPPCRTDRPREQMRRAICPRPASRPLAVVRRHEAAEQMRRAMPFVPYQAGEREQMRRGTGSAPPNWPPPAEQMRRGAGPVSLTTRPDATGAPRNGCAARSHSGRQDRGKGTDAPRNARLPLAPARRNKHAAEQICRTVLARAPAARL